MKDMIVVKDLVKSFRIPLESSSGLKQKLINLLKGRIGYRVFTPLNGVSFTVKQGEFYGIVGKNGSGKSTLLKTLAGIYTPQGGKVQINGSLVPFIELGVGFNPELSGRENVYLNGALLGFDHKEMEEMYDGIVEFAELGDFMEERLKNYSSGMQVRLAFSIAIKAHGDILLLDEVLAVGDASFQQKCYEYFETLKSDKQTVVIVTHDMNAVKRFCTKAMLISGGKIKRTGTPQQIAELYTELNIDDKPPDGNQTGKASKYIDYEVIPKRASIKVGNSFCVRVRGKDLTEKTFVNMSLIYNGFVIADINSKYLRDEDYLANDVEIEVEQSTSGLNPGRYDIHLSVHRSSDEKLIEHLPRVHTFLVKGDNDQSRDGPIRFEGDWRKIGEL